MEPKFERQLPAVRRQALIEATANCLAERGHAATSVREVAARAGVSPGLIRHHFGGIGALVAETYRYVGDKVAGDIADALERAGEDPQARLEAFITAIFRPPILDRDLMATWLAFWSLVGQSDEIRAIHGEIYAEARATLEGLIAVAAEVRGTRLDARLAALGLTAMMDGLWLELCLDPATFTAEEAIAIATGWARAAVEGRMVARSTAGRPDPNPD